MLACIFSPMNLLSKIFNLTQNRNSIPNNWCGLWMDKNGKQLLIEKKPFNRYFVTILNNNGLPYKIDLLNNTQIDTVKLKGQFSKDTYGNPLLQVEAGTNGIGPTYDLYFLYQKHDKTLLATNTIDIDNLIINPKIGMGLYDDWEDDLGVPWALPLENYKKIHTLKK